MISIDIDTNQNQNQNQNHNTISSFTLRQHDDGGCDPNNDNADHDTDSYPFLLNHQMIAQAANC